MGAGPRPIYKILVVDDEADILEVIGAEIAAAGHEPTLSSNSLEAKELLSKNKFDALITDMCMPGLYGHELAKTLQTEGKNSPAVIFISGFFTPEVRAKLNSDGFNELYEKPIAISTLVEKTINAIEKRKSSR